MRILIIEDCNFEDYPTGGQLGFVKSMMSSFKDGELLLAGISTDRTLPVGRWTSNVIDGRKYDFFSIRCCEKTSKKPLIPRRISAYILFRKYMKKILMAEYDRIFIQAPEVLFALPKSVLTITALDSPGVGNPMSIARYKWARCLAKIYDRCYFPKFSLVRYKFATASIKEIGEFVKRSKGLIKEESIIQLPTRYDEAIFKPMDNARVALGLSDDSKIFVTVGRLNWFKGWKLMIDSFKIVHDSIGKSYFYFLGDGEEEASIRAYVHDLELDANVHLLGRKSQLEIAQYLNAADVFVMGSFAEGWSTTLVEACACNVPCVVTDFSSSEDMISDGINGYVVHGRNEEEFATAMVESLNMNRERVAEYNKKFKRLAVSELRNEILSICCV